ncbi:MAG: hypothetical protein EAZ40_16625 [Rhodobacterales bacterium]|nr:MAG: hypothetical protein EAZ40_16625 [Rhodobacterales bacterium]
MQKGRAIRFALLFCAAASFPAKAEKLEWHSEGLKKNVIFCAALFEVRFDWMMEFRMEPTAYMREYDAAQQLQKIYGEHVSTFGSDPSVKPDGGYGPPEIRGLTREPAYLGTDVFWAKQKLLDILTESGARRHRPPICLEDDTCASCWDLLRAMQSQD